MARIPVAILGATGNVGQKFILQLHSHPWFEIRAVGASDNSVGKSYREAVAWRQPETLPDEVGRLTVGPCRPPLDSPVVFSALGSDVAGEIEESFARASHWVFSNARCHRMDEDVPLLLTEVNPDHLAMLPAQRANREWSGAIVTNANCSTIALGLALGPLHRRFGLEQVQVVTLQAVSGAGYPGVASLDILGNVIPHIPGEEAKLERETCKILGKLEADGSVRPAEVAVSAQTTRVPVVDGHMACVSISLAASAAESELLECWRQETPLPSELPTAPRQPVWVTRGQDRPQPRLDSWLGDGMVSVVGRLRPCRVLDFKFVVLGHNTIRGAAGASVLNAEWALFQGLIKQ